jgi:penicillin-insensitive murein endopeptidase
MGWANLGTLQHGRALVESEGIRFLPGRTLHWGTEELVGLLERVGAEMRRRFGARVTVGDLSARHGGPVLRHRSHQSGRDADVCFFARAYTPRGPGAPVELDDYVSFDRNGRSIDGRHVFDTARNWALLEALLSDRRVRVEQVFISAPLRQRLLAYAREHGVDNALLDRAALTLFQPRGVSPHDNHFHVRIECPAGDLQCRAGVHRARPQRRRACAHPGSSRASTARGTLPSSHRRR